MGDDKLHIVYRDGNYTKYHRSEDPRAVTVASNKGDITAIFSFTKPGFIVLKEYYDNPTSDKVKQMVKKFWDTDDQTLNKEFGDQFLDAV